MKKQMTRNGEVLAPLEKGNPRRITDAKCAYRKMTNKQRDAFLAWVEDFHAGEAK